MRIHVQTTSIIDASVDRVWAAIRDFNGLPAWHPVIARSEIEDGKAPEQVGCVRAMRTHDGELIRERLLALDDLRHSFSYSILESGMGVRGYIASVTLHPLTQGGRTFGEWTAEFDCDEDRAEELHRFIGQDVFAAGFEALNVVLGQVTGLHRA
jgi:hypothetical protein